jgi:transposase-like protein
MQKQTTEHPRSSRPAWEGLETLMREKIQGWLQDLLEEEVNELLSRRKSERRQAVDAVAGYRNGFGKSRHLTLSCGTIAVRRPRVRGLEQRFESRILPLFRRQSQEVRELLPELYLHGLAQGDFDLALRGLLGEHAPLSASSVARLKEKWQGEYESWATRRLDELEVVYLWVDGVYVKAGLEKEKAAMLVALAGLSDGSKTVVALTSGYRESTESWAAVLRDLRARGMNAPKLVIGDGHLGIWGALRSVYPETREQRCWNHRVLNVLDKLPKTHHAQATLMLRAMAYAETLQEAERLKAKFQQWCQKKGLGADDRLFSLPKGALAAPEDEQPGGISVRGVAVAHRRGEAVQEGGKRHGHAVAAAHGRREALPPAACAAPAARGPSRRSVHEREPCEERHQGGRRLISFTHLLTEPP